MALIVIGYVIVKFECVARIVSSIEGASEVGCLAVGANIAYSEVRRKSVSSMLISTKS